MPTACRRWPVMALGLAGCSPRPQHADLSKVEASLNPGANAYGIARRSNGKGPANLVQLKAATAEITGGNPDDHLTPSRDGEPFVVLYGLEMSTNPVVAHGKTGKGGGRWVVDMRKMSRLLPDAEIEREVRPPKKLGKS